MRIATLEYHDIVADDEWDGSGFPGPDAASYKVGLISFQTQMEALFRAGIGVIPSYSLKGRSGLPKSNIMLTFDDGGVGAIRNAAPVLAKFNWRGCFFIATERIGGEGFLTREEIVELDRAGHVIGSHSVSHPLRMASLSEEALDFEWRESCHALQEILGHEITCASVPGGSYSNRVAASAAKCGIKQLFTSEPRIRSFVAYGCTVFGRYTIKQNAGAKYVAQVARGKSTRRAQQWLAWNLKKQAKYLMGPAYNLTRKRIYSLKHKA